MLVVFYDGNKRYCFIINDPVKKPKVDKTVRVHTMRHRGIRTEECGSSRKVPVLGQFTMHMVEFIQLNTNQPYVWLEFRHLPSFSVSQPRVWFRHKLKL